MLLDRRSAGLLACLAALLCAGVATAADFDPKSVEFFEAKIRPVLVKHCYTCHSAESKELRAGLFVDNRDGLRKGGDSGPAVVPGDAKKSLLLAAIRYQDLEMPPTGKLPDDVIGDFERWIAAGATDPRDEVTKPAGSKEIDFAKAREHWSLRPVVRADLSRLKSSAWARTDIDRLVADKWEGQQLTPVPDAPKSQLLRRAYFDLIGLPPTPQELKNFLADESSQAFERVVDELLASPRFGERWGRHWLDLARYADSNGRAQNIFFQFAWHYRDYVIDAFNRDLPYDRFIIEQLAGDLLPAETAVERDRLRIATAFLAIGPKTFESAPELFSMDLIDEQIDVTTRAVLGLTVSCARCHDHKFDAIPTKEYYALAGIFRSTDTLFGPSFFQRPAFDKRYHLHPIGADAEKLGEAAFEYRAQLRGLMGKRDQAAVIAYRTQRQIDGIKVEWQRAGNDAPDPKLDELLALHKVQLAERERLKAETKAMEEAAPPLPDFTQGVKEMTQVEDCTLRIRGEFDKPGERIPRGVLTLCSLGEKPAIPVDQSGRLELARWLVAKENPLPARVAVNRIWRQLFGSGIVTSVDNFGVIGERPSHPELLDYLAAQFMESNWSTKRLIREIMLSRTYQLGTRFQEANSSRDPNNVLLWRMTPRRLEVEPFRDAVLSISGALDLQPPRGPHIGLVRNGLLEENPKLAEIHKESNRRTIYLPIVRGQLQEMLQTFDFADPNLLIAQRDERTIPSQSLFMLNSPWLWAQAKLAAERMLSLKMNDDQAKLNWLFQAFFCRAATKDEHATLLKFIAAQRERVQGDEVVVWMHVVQALYASAEFRYLQ
ncbi:PSD1 and planctomycete cytochrome C domain-containing protein [Anatilimnocola floriformis]|uniref:PSD1 and planctomycete cytochrome C domain-containing protein n=1 Tax=Anatilimnocola floriformis TaxID=2948575 RepID=UPI0020C47C8D|nr:PSD1 and planctomycete cytochrome C domain-containing protein [Anatilimnocola floriformis]